MTGKGLALAIAAGALTTALVGGVALATFQPIGTDEQGRSQQIGGPVQDRGPIDHLKAILDPLVAKGTISQAQEKAILQAAQNAATGARSGHARPATRGGYGLIGDVIKTSGDYLGIPATGLAKALASGESLADLAASSTTGKGPAGSARRVDPVRERADRSGCPGQEAHRGTGGRDAIAPGDRDHPDRRPQGWPAARPTGLRPRTPVPTPTPKS